MAVPVEIRRFFLPDDAAALLRDIQASPEPCALWVYATEGLEEIFEFAIRQGSCWYGITQDMTGIGHDEYLLFRVERHHSDAATPQDVPQLPRKQATWVRHARRIQPGPPPLYEETIHAVSWRKTHDFLPPLRVSVFRDRLVTRIERAHGESRVMEQSADVALAFESPSCAVMLQLMAGPFYRPLLRHAESELSPCEEMWRFHYDTDEEIEALRRVGGAEAGQVCRKVSLTRRKLPVDAL